MLNGISMLGSNLVVFYKVIRIFILLSGNFVFGDSIEECVYVCIRMRV